MYRVQIKSALFVVVRLVGIVVPGLALVDDIRVLTIDVLAVGGGETLVAVVVVYIKAGVDEIAVLLEAVSELDESAVEADIDVLTAVLAELFGYRAADVLELGGIVLVRTASDVLDETDEVKVVSGEDVALLVECIVDVCVVGFAVSVDVAVVVEVAVVGISVVEVVLVVVDRLVVARVVGNCVVVVRVESEVVICEVTVLLLDRDVEICVVGFDVSGRITVVVEGDVVDISVVRVVVVDKMVDF